MSRPGVTDAQIAVAHDRLQAAVDAAYPRVTDEEIEALAIELALIEGFDEPNVRHRWKVRTLLATRTMQDVLGR